MVCNSRKPINKKCVNDEVVFNKIKIKDQLQLRFGQK